MAQKVSRQFVAELGPVHVGFVTHKMALGQGFLRVLRFSLASNIAVMHHTHLHLPLHATVIRRTSGQVLGTL